jgi:hypothetical protein
MYFRVASVSGRQFKGRFHRCQHDTSIIWLRTFLNVVLLVEAVTLTPNIGRSRQPRRRHLRLNT